MQSIVFNKKCSKIPNIPINLRLEIPIAAQECRYEHCCHFRTKRKTNCYHLGYQCSCQIWLEAALYHLDSNLDFVFGWHYHCSQLKFSLRKIQSHFYLHLGLFYHFLSRNCSRSRDFAPIFVYTLLRFLQNLYELQMTHHNTEYHCSLVYTEKENYLFEFDMGKS